MLTASPTTATTLTLPDLIARCPYTLHTNLHGAEVARASELWLLEHAHLSPEKRAAFLTLQTGELVALCYPDASPTRLRVIADFMGYLSKLDDWSDELGPDQVGMLRNRAMGIMYDPSTTVGNEAVAALTASFFSRFVSGAGALSVGRFISAMDGFLNAVTQQAHDRILNNVIDFQTYIAFRRENSGCKPCFVLIEYAAGIDLPHSIAEHPCVRTMEDAANDVVSWSNDIYSFNVEQAHGDTHNSVIIVMRERKLDMQDALNYVGDLCIAAMDTFDAAYTRLPSWDMPVDAGVRAYIAGLQNWMIGNLHWSFITHRYFGSDGMEIKRKLMVELLSKAADA